jgi:hypothetical protein
LHYPSSRANWQSCAVNFIISHELNHRQFKVFLDKIISEYGDIVHYHEVHWPSKGKVLQRFLSLLEEVSVFFIGKGQLVSHFEDVSWLCDLASLTFMGTLII